MMGEKKDRKRSKIPVGECPKIKTTHRHGTPKMINISCGLYIELTLTINT